MLAQYFIMKNSDIHIDFVSSANKLKNFKPLENTLIENNENGYKKNKKDGVQYCQQLLDSNPGLKKWESSLNTKKKDDLADCFLQGMWYIQKNINIKYNG
jgi:hypothetical protein